jgi:hypothetical protein
MMLAWLTPSRVSPSVIYTALAPRAAAREVHVLERRTIRWIDAAS